MINHVELSKNIVSKLIEEKFKSLSERKIKIRESLFVKGSADTKSWPWGSRIRLSKELSALSEDELKGLIAHELGHIEEYCKMGYIKYRIQVGLFTLLSNKKLKKNEHDTDKNAIDKGYGKELYLQRKWRYKVKGKNFEKMKNRYLSPSEIIEYMKSKGMSVNFLNKY